MDFLIISDLKDPSDPEGRSYRQVNAAKVHAIPIGTLVELESGARAFVVSHNRDCDQTPLYSLSLDRESQNARLWSHGYPEESLKPV